MSRRGREMQIMVGPCVGRRESIEPLLLLIQVTQVNGCPLPIGSSTAHTVATVVHNQIGHLPVDADECPIVML